MALADAIDAMSSECPYREAFKLPAVISEIQKHAGSQFDPAIVEAALRMIGTEIELKEPAPEVPPELLPTLVPSS